MNPDVLAAVRGLRARSLLTDEGARRLERIAGGDLVSVSSELRLCLYAGVVLLTAGVGILVGEHLDRVGPFAIAAALSLAAASSWLWVARYTPPFSWGKAPGTHFAFDYILLLAVLLTSADLAYVEAHFTPLGPSWPWHLFFMSLLMSAAAFRCDSRVVFSLSLSSFASWRGVSVSFVERGFWRNFETATRLNTLGCGLLFVLLGAVLKGRGRKEHFEPVASYLGWSLVLLSLASGALDDAAFGAYTSLLLLTGTALAIHSFLRGRFPLFAMGGASAYVGLSRWVVQGLHDETLVFLWFLLTSAAAIGGLVAAHRALERTS